jgi:hypothetical protein
MIIKLKLDNISGLLLHFFSCPNGVRPLKPVDLKRPVFKEEKVGIKTEGKSGKGPLPIRLIWGLKNAILWPKTYIPDTLIINNQQVGVTQTLKKNVSNFANIGREQKISFTN